VASTLISSPARAGGSQRSAFRTRSFHSRCHRVAVSRAASAVPRRAPRRAAPLVVVRRRV
jgi:hypothetical protein